MFKDAFQKVEKHHGNIPKLQLSKFADKNLVFKTTFQGEYEIYRFNIAAIITAID